MHAHQACNPTATSKVTNVRWYGMLAVLCCLGLCNWPRPLLLVRTAAAKLTVKKHTMPALTCTSSNSSSSISELSGKSTLLLLGSRQHQRHHLCAESAPPRFQLKVAPSSAISEPLIQRVHPTHPGKRWCFVKGCECVSPNGVMPQPSGYEHFCRSSGCIAALAAADGVANHLSC